jgi:predicted extracellular nuclease
MLSACAAATSDRHADASSSAPPDAAPLADADPSAPDAATQSVDASPSTPDAATPTPDAPPAGAALLVFSEYVEGSSNNKALEIYNRGTTAVALSRCAVARYNNGGTSPNQTQPLDTLAAVNGGTAPTMIGPKAVIVIADPSANATITTAADGSSGITGYNGDDALELICDGNVVDSFGQVGVDPGTEWSSGGVGTVDMTLRRSCAATGDVISTDVFDPSAEWTQSSLDDFAGLGTHNCP